MKLIGLTSAKDIPATKFHLESLYGSPPFNGRAKEKLPPVLRRTTVSGQFYQPGGQAKIQGLQTQPAGIAEAETGNVLPPPPNGFGLADLRERAQVTGALPYLLSVSFLCLMNG